MSIGTDNWLADAGVAKIDTAGADEAILKPARYLGGEIHAIARPGVSPAMALCFPDVYEIGMSHLGLKILYEAANADPRFAVERVFAPWRDRAAQLRRRGMPLCSLETGRALKDFDLVGFSVSYELSYTDVLDMLDLGGVPLRARDRSDADPIVLAGGHCALHMAPLREFLDGVFLGEADEAMIQLLEACLGPRDRQERLNRLAEIEGVHLHAEEFAHRAPRRRVFYGFSRSRGVVRPVVPNIQAVHDRVSVEIMRGCTRGCRFCQAGYITRPERYRDVDAIIANAEDALEATGYDEVSLVSLSSCDHPGIRPIAQALHDRFTSRHISISIPSTRVDAFDIEVHKLTGSGRRTGITLAPEVGSERMDRVINKGSPRAKLIENVTNAFAGGWKVIKLYYLIGIPFETTDDAAAIGEQLALLAPIARRARGELHASVSILCPKPWTPFQWLGMEEIESLNAKKAAIRAVTPNGVKLAFHDPDQSLVEAALARGGVGLGVVVEAAWRRGATLQAWGEFFDAAAWRMAFQDAGTTLETEAYRSYGENDTLPWEDVSIGVERAFLRREWDAAARAARGEDRYLTEDCSTGRCTNCGMPCVGTHPTVSLNVPPQVSANFVDNAAHPASVEERASAIPIAHGSTDSPQAALEALSKSTPPPAPQRLSFTFSRRGPSAQLGHLDLMRLFERALRRAQIGVAATQGFNPRPRLRFALALPLGVAAEHEYVEADVWDVDAATFENRLNAALPETVRVAETIECAPGRMPVATSAHYRLTSPCALAIHDRLASLLDQPVTRARSQARAAGKSGRKRDQRGRPRSRENQTVVEGGAETLFILGDHLTLGETQDSDVVFTLKIGSSGSLSIHDMMALIRDLDPEPSICRLSLTFR